MPSLVSATSGVASGFSSENPFVPVNGSVPRDTSAPLVRSIVASCSAVWPACLTMPKPSPTAAALEVATSTPGAMSNPKTFVTAGAMVTPAVSTPLFGGFWMNSLLPAIVYCVTAAVTARSIALFVYAVSPTPVAAAPLSVRAPSRVSATAAAPLFGFKRKFLFVLVTTRMRSTVGLKSMPTSPSDAPSEYVTASPTFVARFAPGVIA